MAVSYKDYYALLGVDRSADKDTIARAFKKLAKKYHPDLNPGDKKAEEKFKEINEAYEVLKDPKKRQLYDQLGPNWQQGQQFDGFGGFGGFGGQGFDRGNVHFSFNGRDMGGMGGGDFSDFFQSLFGGRDVFGGQGGRARSMRGSDLQMDLSLSLEDVQKGGQRSLQIPDGTSYKTIKVNIPQGVRDEGRLRLAGQGQPGPGGRGDLYVQIHYKPHPVFRVDGSNLHCTLNVAPWEAVLGGTVEVPTLEGMVQMNLPAGCSSGRKFRLRGKGLGPEGSRGDIYATLQIQVPAHSSPEELDLWNRLARCSTFRARG